MNFSHVEDIMTLKKRMLLYVTLLFIFGVGTLAIILWDFARTPLPPDITLAAFNPKTPATTKATMVWKPKFPVIDIHAHPQLQIFTANQLVSIMDEAGVRMISDLDTFWGRNGERLQALTTKYSLKHPDRFLLFFHFSLSGIDNEGYIEREINKLEQAAARGIKGIKVWKDLGMMRRDQSGQLIRLDDSRLDPIWEKIGELGLPVLIHTADPAAFWHPADRYNERYEELRVGGKWMDTYDKAGYPKLEELLVQRENLLRKHPNTIFIGAHMGELANNLKELGRLFDQYPNFYVDTSDRLGELGRQPYTARKFLIQYQDRILFGIDLYPEAHVYRDYYRFFETKDEYFDYPRHYFKHGRWKIYGVGLPDSVLAKIYYQNATRLLKLPPF